MKNLYALMKLDRSASAAVIRGRLSSISDGSLRAAVEQVLLWPGRRAQYDRVHHAVEQISLLRAGLGMGGAGFGGMSIYQDFRRADTPVTNTPFAGGMAGKEPAKKAGSRRFGWALLFASPLLLILWIQNSNKVDPPTRPAIGEGGGASDSSPTGDSVPLDRSAAARGVYGVAEDKEETGSDELSSRSNPDPVALPLPSTGDFYFGKPNKSRTFITVKTGPNGANVLAKIESVNGEEVARGFIRAGDSLTFHVGFGEYVLKTAYGNQWYGEEQLFGDDTTRRTRADDTFLLQSSGEYWEVELILQAQGNLREVEISKEEF